MAGNIAQGRRYDDKDFNRIIKIKEREAYRVQLFIGMIDQREKTIVFCAPQLHALAVRDLVNQLKTPQPAHPRPAVLRACHRQRRRDRRRAYIYARSRTTIPTILTTSQKLSTGVDARNVRIIVLMRPVGPR